VLALCASWFAPAEAGQMLNDPKGFHGIAWGTGLQSQPDFEIARRGEHVTEYRLKNVAPALADIPVDSILFSSMDDQFARVTIRYHGDHTHTRVLHYLEQQFGPIERLPGQMIRGLNQQYNWRGTDSEINLTYQAGTERGFIFLDSRTLVPRFNDFIADTAD